MKATYSDFITENPMCSGLKNNNSAKEVFEILSKDENIIKMLELSDQDQPALSACVVEIEKWHDTKIANEFTFISTDPSGNFNKNATGRMIKTILAPFGYEVWTRKGISKSYGNKYFSSASCYKRKENPARLVVKKIIVEAEETKADMFT